jgi:hypothetical protein
LKSRKLIRPNLRTNDFDIEFIKKALVETKNGKQFGALLEEKGYEFTKVHTMKVRHGDEYVYEIMKEYGCLPVPSGMQCPYCKINYYNGEKGRIEKKLAKHMESTHLIKNNNQALNILLNLYGNDWRMDFISKHEIIDVNYHERDLGFCKITGCNAVEKDDESYQNHVRFCLFEQEFGNYAPFWELLKMNLMHSQEMDLMKFRIRCNTLRIEEGQRMVAFTNDQMEIEKFTNQVVKGKNLLGDMRIRKKDDGLPKERLNRRIPTLNREEKVIRTVENYKNLKKEWKTKVGKYEQK